MCESKQIGNWNTPLDSRFVSLRFRFVPFATPKRRASVAKFQPTPAPPTRPFKILVKYSNCLPLRKNLRLELLLGLIFNAVEASSLALALPMGSTAAPPFPHNSISTPLFDQRKPFVCVSAGRAPFLALAVFFAGVWGFSVSAWIYFKRVRKIYTTFFGQKYILLVFTVS